MPLLRNVAGCVLPAMFTFVVIAGCTSAPRRAEAVHLRSCQHSLAASGPANATDLPATSSIVRVSHDEPPGLDAAAIDAEDSFAGRVELSLSELLAQVEQRNPSLHASLAAWAAAAERYPQAVALDDPVFQSMLAPGSFPSSSSVQASYLVGIAQKIPWAGKRALRGQIAQAQTTAASLDTQDVRLRLAEATRLAFFEYYLVRRDLELNAANRDAVQRFRETANAKFEATQVTEQDVLQADVELAMLDSRRIELAQNEKVAVARINTLLHREPQLALPPPPQRLEVSDSLPDVEALRQAAVEQRPDLSAQAARIQAEQAAVALAAKEFYPDFEFIDRKSVV